MEFGITHMTLISRQVKNEPKQQTENLIPLTPHCKT